MSPDLSPSPDYAAFLAAKAPPVEPLGFEIDPARVNPAMKPHAAALTLWGVKGGRRGYFTAFGLHKTTIQLETGRLILEEAAHAEGLRRRGLIVLPLGVRQEFVRDAVQVLGWDRPPEFIRETREVASDGLFLTNYESVREGKVDPEAFTWASLDEASCLRSYGSKTFQSFLPLFRDVPYRHVATATPSPNRFKELIHYAGFLGVMDTGQALTRFFQRNPSKAGDLTLYPHKEEEFWLWVNSWGAFVQKPSDLGFSDEGYDLPPLEVRWHEVPTIGTSGHVERDGQVTLLPTSSAGIQHAARARREGLDARIAKAVEIRTASPDEHFILWHDLEDERRALEAALPDAVPIYGTQDLDLREQAILDFSDGKFGTLAAKPVIAGSGCNFQRHCHRAVFAGVSHKFNDFIQAIYRIQRFGQAHPVTIDIIFADREREVVRDLKAKWARDEELRRTMSDIIRKYGLDVRAMAETLKRSMGVERVEASGRDWTAVNSDCVEETRRMVEGSVDLIVTSIPFANHYEYTPNYSDFGHTDDNDHFWAQMDYLSPELFRVLAPGRIAAIHVKDRILFGSVTGYGRPAVSPFHAEAITHFRRHGFVFAGMVTINTDVVHENNGTYRLGYTEMCKDGSRMGVGSPEYLLLFFKPQTDRTKGYADVRVARNKADYSLARWQIDAHAFWRSSGERLPTADELALMPTDVLARLYAEVSQKTLYDHETHVRIGEALEARGALPSSFMVLAPGSHDPDIWHDVSRIHTLNGEQSKRGLENHICPLQFDIVDRAIRRWSNPGETVFDPFGGLMTVPYRALKHGRKGIGVELNPQYFLDGVAHLKAMEEEVSAPSLFDLMDALPGPSATPADSSLQKMQSAPAQDGDPVPARLPATGTKIRTILALVADGTDSAKDLALTLDDTSASIARDLAGLAKQGLVRNTSPGRKVGRYVPTEACLRLMGLETAAQDRPEAA